MEYIILALVLIAIALQVKTFLNTRGKINELENLFPKNPEFNVSTFDGDENGANKRITINTGNASGKHKVMLNEINAYLRNVKDKTLDYNIIKEIVLRNSQAIEEEVDTMLTVPLYYGLMATIIGIAVGIIVFAHKDLGNLLSGANMSADGISILLTDIGIAMIASFCGVLATKLSTSHYNRAKVEMGKNQNQFLTNIHKSDLMCFSDDLTGALLKMTQDLNTFNATFAKNTQELKETLQSVKVDYEAQAKLLETIEKLKITKIAKANIEVYDKLQGCTDELEKLFMVFANSEQYLEKVVQLNNNIGSVEERTRLFEELGNYFKNEVEYVKERQGMMRQQMSSLDSVLQEAMDNIGVSLGDNLKELTKTFQTQNQHIQLLIEEQQNALKESLDNQQKAVNERIAQLDTPFAGLKETFADGIAGIKAAFEEQNTAIKDAMDAQKQTLEKSMTEQQQLMVKKFQETPGQLKALADLATAVERLNANLANNSNGEKAKDKFGFIVPVCACGSFVVLTALLVMKLLGL